MAMASPNILVVEDDSLVADAIPCAIKPAAREIVLPRGHCDDCVGLGDVDDPSVDDPSVSDPSVNDPAGRRCPSRTRLWSRR